MLAYFTGWLKEISLSAFDIDSIFQDGGSLKIYTWRSEGHGDGEASDSHLWIGSQGKLTTLYVTIYSIVQVDQLPMWINYLFPTLTGYTKRVKAHKDILAYLLRCLP